MLAAVAGEREVAKAYCAGCGATANLQGLLLVPHCPYGYGVRSPVSQGYRLELSRLLPHSERELSRPRLRLRPRLLATKNAGCDRDRTQTATFHVHSGDSA